jgi:hypothetical protein
MRRAGVWSSGSLSRVLAWLLVGLLLAVADAAKADEAPGGATTVVSARVAPIAGVLVDAAGGVSAGGTVPISVTRERRGATQMVTIVAGP